MVRIGEYDQAFWEPICGARRLGDLGLEYMHRGVTGWGRRGGDAGEAGAVRGGGDAEFCGGGAGWGVGLGLPFDRIRGERGLRSVSGIRGRPFWYTGPGVWIGGGWRLWALRRLGWKISRFLTVWS